MLMVIDQNFIIDRLIHNSQKVRHLGYDPAHRRRIGSRYLLIKLGNAEALYDIFLFFRVTDRAAVVLDRYVRIF